MPVLPTIVTQTKNLLIFVEGKVSKRIRNLIPKKTQKAQKSAEVVPKEGVIGVEPAVQAKDVSADAKVESPKVESPKVATESAPAETEALAEPDLDQKPAELK